VDIVDTNWTEQLEVIVKVLIAGILGGLIGLERELAYRPAGLRTHAILAAAAALLVGSTDILIGHFVGETAPAVLRADPIRVIEAIVTGVGFLGAGTIFRNRDATSIEGLTTAASLLLVAAIGITVALQQVLLAVLVTVFTLVLLRVVAWFVPATTHGEKT
jgi:putative Mg2+ transporter-C (MgtC) family protein